MNGSLAIYPGSFDPVTKGHLDILRRALGVVDHVVLAVAYNQEKPSGLFSVDERLEILREVTQEFGDKVTADSFHGLLIDYARNIGAGTIIRGLRAVADFEYEFQMTLMNRHLAPDVETMFLMADEAYFYTSSKLVKEVTAFGGDISAFVPEYVAKRLAEKFDS
jgi:pantetheine-phosphate adenylyltransferase